MKELKIADNIRFFRKANNLTQEELSKQLGGSKNLVSNYENGISTPDIYTLVKLADIFDITLDELVGIVKMKSFKFAENLKYYRKQAGLTQSQLAAHFNSDKSLISNYENGKNVPDIFKMWELADIFDITLDELVGRE